MELNKSNIKNFINIYNRGRFIFITLVLVVGSVCAYFWTTFPLTPLIVVIGLSYIASIICLFLLKIDRALSTILHLLRIFDTILILVIIYLTGGIESLFTPILFFHIFLLGIFSSRLRYCLIFTTFITSSYITIILLEHLGIIPHHHLFPIGCAYNNNFYTFVLAGLNGCFFYITAIISGYLSNVFEKKVIELDKIKKSEHITNDFLNAILNNMADGIIITDVNLRILQVNAATQKMLGHNEDELKDKPVIDFIPDEALPILLKKVIKEGKVASEELEMVHPIDHHKEILTLKITALKDSSDKTMGLIIVSRDVTEEELVEHTRSKFLSLVSHELRTPLTVIKAYTETLLDGVDDPQEVKEFLETINEESDVLTKEINEILMLTEMDVKHIPLKKRLISLPQLIRELIDPSKITKETILEKMAQEQNIEVNIKIEENLPEIRVDYIKIKMAIEQLIETGIKWTPPAGKVTILTEKYKDGIKVCVMDIGREIAQDKLSEVFTPFYQLEDPVTKEAKGIGLGMSLVKHIIETHGGEIRAESEEGKGSSFIFTLPI